MKILKVVEGEALDITEIVTSIRWSGDKNQAARVLTFGLASSSTDKWIPVINLKMGDMIKLLDGKGEERFRGYVFTKGKSLAGSEIEITCYDGLIYLLKSRGTYNFKNNTPGNITKKVCADFGIPYGHIIKGSPIKRIFNGVEIYNIIMTAYTFESKKTKKQYMPVMIKGQLHTIEKGLKRASFILDPETAIIDATFSESMEDSINVVKMYSEDGEYKGEVKLDGVPGRLQDVHTGTKQEAESLLKGIAREATIEALGDFDCVTGNAVIVKEEHTGLNGLFYIDNDEHTFENDNHTMSLGISFENIMDSQEAGDDPDEVKEEDRGSGSVSGGNKLATFISAAESMIGYSYSQSNRMGKSSADCSSLVGRAMKKAGVTNNAQLTTRSITGDSRFTKISKANIRKGDILWERGHMAIYMGGNKTLEARSSIKRVDYANLGNRFTHAYRIKGL